MVSFFFSNGANVGIFCVDSTASFGPLIRIDAGCLEQPIAPRTTESATIRRSISASLSAPDAFGTRMIDRLFDVRKKGGSNVGRERRSGVPIEVHRRALHARRHQQLTSAHDAILERRRLLGGPRQEHLDVDGVAKSRRLSELALHLYGRKADPPMVENVSVR